MSEAAIKQAVEEAAPGAQVVRSDGDLLVYYSGFNLSKFVRFLARQPHVVGSAQRAKGQCTLDKCPTPELCNDLSWCDAKLLRDGDCLGEDGDQSGTHAGYRHKDNRTAPLTPAEGEHDPVAFREKLIQGLEAENDLLRAQVEKLTAQVDQEIQNWKLRNRMACEAERKVRLLKSALENSAARFNLMAGVGLVNGADPKTGYAEAMSALRSLSDTSTVGEPK